MTTMATGRKIGYPLKAEILEECITPPPTDIGI